MNSGTSFSRLPLLILALSLAQCGRDGPHAPETPGVNFPSAEAMQARLGRGVNLGNALDAPTEGEWKVILKAEYFKQISDLGFNSVRIPVRWSAHAQVESPFAIDTAFMARVAWAVDQALSNRLAVVIDMHHYDTLMSHPAAEKPRFLALWKQIARHFANHPPELLLEILNEPREALNAMAWNGLLKQAIDTIRAVDPHRTLVVGTAPWGGLTGLRSLELPADTNLIVTVHYYEPHAFTHQGASFEGPSAPPLGTTWRATAAQRAKVDQDIDLIKTWAATHDHPIYIGEFGTYMRVDTLSRALYTEYTASRFTQAGFAWALWNWSSDFGILVDSTGEVHRYLIQALLNPGKNGYLDSVLRAASSLDLDTYVVFDDFEDSVPCLPASALAWARKQGLPVDSSSLAAWYALYSRGASLMGPDGARLHTFDELEAGKANNFTQAIGDWGYQGKGLHIKGSLNGGGYPWFNLGAGILGGWDSTFTDLTKLTAVYFRAKGRGQWNLEITSDSAYFGYPPADAWGQISAHFLLKPEWETFLIPVESLVPKAYSKQAAAGLKWEDVRTKIISLDFFNGQSYGETPSDSLEMWIDDIRLIGVTDKDLGL